MSERGSLLSDLPRYDAETHQWEPRCPYGDVCTGCDAAGYCTRAAENEEPAAPSNWLKDGPSPPRCPFCGRIVDTFERNGVVVMMGHRVSSMHTVGTPWCEGGGRSVKA